MNPPNRRIFLYPPVPSSLSLEGGNTTVASATYIVCHSEPSRNGFFTTFVPDCRFKTILVPTSAPAALLALVLVSNILSPSWQGVLVLALVLVPRAGIFLSSSWLFGPVSFAAICPLTDCLVRQWWIGMTPFKCPKFLISIHLFVKNLVNYTTTRWRSHRYRRRYCHSISPH